MLLPQHKIVKFIAVYVALGFLVMEILYFSVWCRPFHEYWAVPTDNSKFPLILHALRPGLLYSLLHRTMLRCNPPPNHQCSLQYFF
jgi:hypothetical protein